MSAALILIHGRSQHMPAALRRDRARVAAHIEARRRSWLAGLAKGLILAGQEPISERRVYFPFYGNDFADRIDAHRAGGGSTPNLESLAAPSDNLTAIKEQMLLQGAYELGFQPAQEIGYQDPGLAKELRDRPVAAIEAFDWHDPLRLPFIRNALQFLSRKTGVAEWVIEEFLDDVAYYLELPNMRERVLEVVQEKVDEALEKHDSIVLVSHSLGTIVGYDLFKTVPQGIVRMFVTTGSPLGYPIVQRNLLDPPPVGSLPKVPKIASANGRPWLNAYDVRDIVALIHPLADCFEGGSQTIGDERTHNPQDPHSIEDYLSDPDVAGPIGTAAKH